MTEKIEIFSLISTHFSLPSLNISSIKKSENTIKFTKTSKSIINSYIDHQQQKFLAEIPEYKSYCFSIEIIDIDDFKQQNNYNSKQIIPKFEFSLQGIIPNYLQMSENQQNNLFSKENLKNKNFKSEKKDDNQKEEGFSLKSDFIDKKLLSKENIQKYPTFPPKLQENFFEKHAFIVQKLNSSSERVYELQFFKYSKNSKPLNNLLFLLCLQKEEKLIIFPNVIDLAFIKKNEFRLPFMEPDDYFIMLSERKDKILFSYLFEFLFKFEGILYEEDIIKDFCNTILEFLKRKLAFWQIDFRDWAFFPEILKIRLINPVNVIIFKEDFQIIEECFKENYKELWEIYICFFTKTIENLLDIYKFMCFSLLFSFYQMKHKIKNLEFSQYFQAKQGNCEDLHEKIIFSLLKADSLEKIEEILSNSNEKLVDFFNKNAYIMKEIPREYLDLKEIPKDSKENEQIYLNSQKEFLNILLIFLKFEESLILIKKLKIHQNSDILTQLFLNQKAAFLYLKKDELDKGLEILNQSLLEIQNIYGNNSNEVSANIYFIISLFHIQKNRFVDAIKLLETGYSLVRYSKKSWLFFEITYNLGHLYKETNNVDKSFTFFKKIRNFLWENLSEVSLIKKTYCEILGMLYIQKHEYNSAKELLEIAYEIYQIRYDSENLKKNEKYSNILNSLGMCYFELRNPKKALQFYDKSLEIKAKLFSQDYENKGETLNNLALIYAELGDHQKAIEMNLKAIEIYTQNKEKISLANSLNNLGLSYKSSSEFEKAIDSMLQALKLFEEELGKSHIQIGKTLNNIGMIYYDKGEINQAILYCEQALENYRQFYNENPQNVGRALNNLGILHSGNKDYEKAIDYYEKAFDIKSQSDNKNEIDIADTSNNLANVYFLLKRFEPAIRNYTLVLEIRDKILGESHNFDKPG